MPVAYEVLGEFPKIIRHLFRYAEVLKTPVKDDLLVKIHQFGGIFPNARYIVGNEDDGNTHVMVHSDQCLKKLFTGFRIKSSRWFVKN